MRPSDGLVPGGAGTGKKPVISALMSCATRPADRSVTGKKGRQFGRRGYHDMTGVRRRDHQRIAFCCIIIHIPSHHRDQRDHQKPKKNISSKHRIYLTCRSINQRDVPGRESQHDMKPRCAPPSTNPKAETASPEHHLSSPIYKDASRNRKEKEVKRHHVPNFLPRRPNRPTKTKTI